MIGIIKRNYSRAEKFFEINFKVNNLHYIIVSNCFFDTWFSDYLN